MAVGEGFKNLYTCKPSSNQIPNKFLPLLSSFVNNVTTSNTCHVKTELFHARMGHTSNSKLIHISDCSSMNTSDFFCDTCMLAKQHRLSFSRSITRSLLPFELLHVEL